MTVDFNGRSTSVKPLFSANLYPGDIFLLENDLYMKIQEIEVFDNGEGCYFNAVNMTTGKLYGFFDCAIITLIDGEFKVNR